MNISRKTKHFEQVFTRLNEQELKRLIAERVAAEAGLTLDDSVEVGVVLMSLGTVGAAEVTLIVNKIGEQ